MLQIAEQISDQIPQFQWSVQCPVEGKIKISKIEVPIPQYGEVLVKCFAAPINPSDLGLMKGYYSEHKIFDIQYPTVPGWEGAGIVVSYGGYCVMGRALMGSRVAFSRNVAEGNKMICGGTYQQYVIAQVMNCVPIPNTINMPIGSMHFVNPITAIGLVEQITNRQAQAAIQTAASGQLGKMIINLCKIQNIPLINIVRKQEQVKILKEQNGCEYVLNQNDENFSEQLKQLSKELKATVILECIGGTQTAKILECMPPKSHCVFYGSLREEALSDFDPLLLIGRNYSIQGFILDQYIKSKGMIGLLQVIRQVSNMLSDKTLQSNISKCVKFSEFKNGITDYYKNMSGGKIILCPNEFDEALENAKEDSLIFQEFSIRDLTSD